MSDDTILGVMKSVLFGGNDSQCSASLTFFGLNITEPSLIPTCLMAAFIGFSCFYTISNLKKFKGHFVYSLSFLMFGCMMTDAMFVHCFLDRSSVIGTIASILDVGLTSSIGMSFLFNGLVDLNILPDASPLTLSLMLLTYMCIFAGWIYTFITNWQSGFYVLYLGAVVIGCGTYCISQVFAIISSRSCKGLSWLMLGGLSGLIGILSITKWSSWICSTWSSFLSPDFWWFVLSDLAMFCIFKYYTNRTVITSSKKHLKKGTIDETDDLEMVSSYSPSTDGVTFYHPVPIVNYPNNN